MKKYIIPQQRVFNITPRHMIANSLCMDSTDANEIEQSTDILTKGDEGISDKNLWDEVW